MAAKGLTEKMSKRDRDLEHKVLQLIKECGEEGILQSHLWKKINASSREGSRISLRLEKSGLIQRKKSLSHGKWTYKLVAMKRAVTVDTVAATPCFFCMEQERCSGGGAISPMNCDLLDRYVEARRIPEGLGPAPCK